MIPRIPAESPDDPRLLDYTILKERELLRDRGVFIAEGRLVVERLLDPRCPFVVRSMLVLDTRADEAHRLARTRLAAGRTPPFPIFVASRRVMDSIVGFRFHQGCLAVGEHPAGPAASVTTTGEPALESTAEPEAGRILTDAAARTVVVLEDLVDLDNVGSVFRNAAGLGGDAVLLSPRCADPLYRKSIRTSMGHALLVPFARFRRWPEGLARARAEGFVVVALTPAADALALADAARELHKTGRAPRRLALVLGAEGAGLSPAALAASDLRVRISMTAGADSINVATACAIALHCLVTPADPTARPSA